MGKSGNRDEQKERRSSGALLHWGPLIKCVKTRSGTLRTTVSRGVLPDGTRSGLGEQEGGKRDANYQNRRKGGGCGVRDPTAGGRASGKNRFKGRSHPGRQKKRNVCALGLAKSTERSSVRKSNYFKTRKWSPYGSKGQSGKTEGSRTGD